MLRFKQDGTFHEIDVEGTKVRLKSMSLGSRIEKLQQTEKLMEVKDGKLVNASQLAELIQSIDGRTDVEQAINDLETAADLLKLVRAIVNFSTLGETEAGNSPSSSNGKPVEETPTGLSRVDEVVAAEPTASRKDG